MNGNSYISLYISNWVIAISLTIAFLLDRIPIPIFLEKIRPDLVLVVLLYWVILLPHKINILTSWVIGLFLDIGRDTLLGQHALAFSIVAYLALKACRHIRLTSIWQQTLFVAILLIIKQILIFWINGIIGYPPRDWWYLAPTLGGIIIWPLIFIILSDISYYFQIN